MTTQQNELQAFLTERRRRAAGALQRHEAGARVVSHYDFNNTYQYVISREETHLSWLQNALAEFDAPLPPASPTLPVPEVREEGQEGRAGALRASSKTTRKGLGGFVERWRPRVAEMTHARHRTMLNVVLGESLEHQRLFEQAAAGLRGRARQAHGWRRARGRSAAVRWLE